MQMNSRYPKCPLEIAHEVLSLLLYLKECMASRIYICIWYGNVHKETYDQ